MGTLYSLFSWAWLNPVVLIPLFLIIIGSFFLLIREMAKTENGTKVVSIKIVVIVGVLFISFICFCLLGLSFTNFILV